MERSPVFQARLATTNADLRAAQRLRYRAFIEGTGATRRSDERDKDAFDDVCRHILVEHIKTGQIAATLRLLPLSSGADIEKSYSALYYDLTGLRDFNAPMAEIGRFSVDPAVRDPEVLRIAWGALTAFVDDSGVEMLFGCSSFKGIDAKAYSDAFAMLKERHLGPKRWLPRIKAPNVFRFAERLRNAPNRVRALKTMPPLLRSYLNMGGWVSDHAVVDRDLNTLHVFTGLEVGSIPPARVRTLRGVAG